MDQISKPRLLRRNRNKKKMELDDENQNSTDEIVSVDKKSDTQVFVLSPDMLKKFGVNLNLPKKTKTFEFSTKKELDNSTSIDVLNSVDKHLFSDISLSENSLFPMEIESNLESISDSLLLEDMNGVEIEELNLGINKHKELEEVAKTNVDLNEIDNADNELSISPLSQVDSSITAHDKENLNDNINTFPVVCTENIHNHNNSDRSLDGAVEIFSDIPHISSTYEWKSKNTLNAEELGLIIDENVNKSVNKNIMDKTNSNTGKKFTSSQTTQSSETEYCIFSDDFTINDILPFEKPEAPNMLKLDDVKEPKVFKKAGKTYQCKSPKFQSTVSNNRNKQNSNSGTNQNRQQKFQIDDTVNKNVENVEKPSKALDNMKRDEIMEYLRKYLNRDLENTKNLDESKCNENFISLNQKYEKTYSTKAQNGKVITSHISSDKTKVTKTSIDSNVIRDNNFKTDSDDQKKSLFHNELDLNYNKTTKDSSPVTSNESINSISFEKTSITPIESSEHSLNEKSLTEDVYINTESFNDSIRNNKKKAENILTKTENLIIPAIVGKRKRKKNAKYFDVEPDAHDELSTKTLNVIDNSLAESENTVKPPKQETSGRKKKYFDTESNLQVDSSIGCIKEVNDSSVVSENSVAVLPKKRARKKKCFDIESNLSVDSNIGNIEEVNESSIVSENSVAVLPKKRARKKKCLESNLQVDSSIGNIEEINDSTIVLEDLESVAPKKRGRKKKKLDIESNVENIDVVNNSSIVLEDLVPLIPKKRGRKKKIIDQEQNLSNDENVDSMDKSSIVSEDSAQTKHVNNLEPDLNKSIPKNVTASLLHNIPEKYHDSIAVKMLKLFAESNSHRSKRKKMNTKNNIVNALKNFDLPDTISKCAICSKEMSLQLFPMHSWNEHNLLSWVVGEEPIDLNEKYLVTRLLKKKCDVIKKLTCEKCQSSRNSVDGFMSHLLFCQKTEEESAALLHICSICKKKMLPSSVKLHMEQHKRDELKKQAALEYSETESTTAVIKRKAATVALESFKKMEHELEISDMILWITEQKNLFFSPFNNILHRHTKMMWDRQKNDGLPMKCVRPNCGYSDYTEDGIKEHHTNSCPILKTERFFKCYTCEQTFHKKDDIAFHIWDKHKELLPKSNVFIKTDDIFDEDVNKDELFSNSDSDEYSSNFETTNKVSTRKHYSKSKASFNYDFILTDKHSSNELAVRVPFTFTGKVLTEHDSFYEEYTNTFIFNNMSTEALFSDIFCKDFLPLSNAEADSFLPTLKQSCNVAHSICDTNLKTMASKNFEWKKYNLFESNLCSDSAIMWCGGPVQALGWIPGERENKYLVVAADFNFCDKKANKTYSHNNILQIWDTGKLLNDSGKCDMAPKMVYAITHEYGVVWDLDFCPSGCCDDCYASLKQQNCNFNSHIKIGMLAIACSNGKAYIYALPNALFLSESESKFYKTKPVIELHINREYDDDDFHRNVSQASKIRWSQLKGHNIIAVGYSNGFVALFDVKTQSPLLRSETSNCIHIFPYLQFQPYLEPITGLTFIPKYHKEDSDDNSLAIGITSSMGCSIWINSKLVLHRKGRYTSVTSSNPWPQIIVMPEKIPNPNVSSLIPTGSSNHIIATTLAGNYEVTVASGRDFVNGGSLDSNIWNDKVVIASANGNIGIFPYKTPLMRKHQIKTKFSKRNIISFSKEVHFDKDVLSDSVSKNSPNQTSLLSYEATMESYGLIFIDLPKISNFDQILKDWEQPPDNFNYWPLREYTCVKTHPSESSYHFFACGCNAGIVRILCSKYFSYLNDKNARNSYNFDIKAEEMKLAE